MPRNLKDQVSWSFIINSPIVTRCSTLLTTNLVLDGGPIISPGLRPPLWLSYVLSPPSRVLWWLYLVGLWYSSESFSTLASTLKWSGMLWRLSSEERRDIWETRWKGSLWWAALTQCENRQRKLQVVLMERNSSCWTDRDQNSYG